MCLLRVVVAFVIITLHHAIAESGVTLTSNIESEGRTSACQGEVVVYTCRVANTGVLQWAIESFHEIQGDPILFSVGYHPVGTVVHGDGGLFNATLTKVDPIMVYWGDLSSQLTVLAHESLNVKWIWCSNGELSESDSPRILHQIGASPSAPLSLSYSIESHDIASYSVTVEWQPPGDSGGIGVSNYTTTLRTSHKLHTYTEREQYLHHLSLLYNQIYSFEVFASNCIGGGSSAFLSNVYAISCGLPELPTPANDTMVDVDSTHEGSTVTFLCADGEETLSIKCMRNGSWTPEPSEINCSVLKPPVSNEGHCQRPETTKHSHIEVESTTIGGVVTYQCDDGFEPTEIRLTVCSAMGHWVPDTAAFMCTEPVDCGVPVPPTNGSVVYTGSTEGSRALIHCGPGLALRGHDVSLCNANSSWVPNPASQLCIHSIIIEKKVSGDDSNDVIYCTITGAVVLLIALPVGAISGILLLKYCSRQPVKKKRRVRPPIPIYEDVTLRNQTPHVICLNYNEAYGVHTSQN